VYPRATRRTKPVARVPRAPRVPTGTPRWLLVTAGLVVVAVGVVLVTRPLDSLTALSLYIGISCLISGLGDVLVQRPQDDRLRLFSGALWCVAGVAVLLFIGRSVSLLGPFVAALLVGSGAVRLLDLRRGTTSERMLDGLFGLAELVFGLAALLWPDATLLVVAILFGMRSVGFGVSLVWRGWPAGRPSALATAVGAGCRPRPAGSRACFSWSRPPGRWWPGRCSGRGSRSWTRSTTRRRRSPAVRGSSCAPNRMRATSPTG